MIHLVKTNKIKTNPNNPRIIKDNKFKKLVKSIKYFPEMLKLRPIVVNKEMVVLGGNMRLKACIDAGLKEIWVAKAEDLTPEQEQEFIIKDNVSFGEWDWDIIANDWDTQEIEDWGVDLIFFDKKEDELDEKYSEKIGQVTYEPKESNHIPTDLFIKETKFDNDIEKIQNKEIKELLKLRTAFFTKFKFSKIADYYAYQANEEEKRIFEKLALVLLDKHQLIENGFSDLIEELGHKDYE
jgi:hypothetical protein